MSRALIVLSLLLSAPAFAQDEGGPPVVPEAAPQPPPGPAYGSVRTESMGVKVAGILGFTLGGAKPFGDFGNAFNFGPDVGIRGGVELLIGPGISIQPDAEIHFGRFGSVTELDAQGISGAIYIGLLFGGRFGFEIANLVTPYFDLHFGYYHGQITGDACSLAGANCGQDKFGMDFGFGAEFWLTPTVGLGPFTRFNFVFTDNVTSNWFSFGPSLTLKL